MSDVQARRKAAERLLAIREARTSLMAYSKLQMPHPDAPDDPAWSRYEETPLARLLCQVFEMVHERKLKRVAISVGPQMGKSQVTSRNGPAWLLGRRPGLNLMLGTYNQPFAEEFGEAVRQLVRSDAHRQVFPEHELRKGKTDLLITTADGRAAFVGRGGSGSGKPADVFIVDDPIKDDVEAQSPTTRDQTWSWFNKVAMTRCHGDSAIVVVHTRWHQDDLIGRLCDPEHPDRNGKYAGIADRWTYINIPAVIKDPGLAKSLGLTLEVQTDPKVIQQFGKVPMTSLWPNRKPLDFLAEAKQSDPSGFGALYMGNPTPEDGDFFKRADILPYYAGQLPSKLRLFGASDHALSTKQHRDSSVIGLFGLDEQGDIWVLPDLKWAKLATDGTVNTLIEKFKRRPQLWFMENEAISKSFGPFLRERMRRENVPQSIRPITPAADKMTRARAIQGRIQLRTVHLPAYVPWYDQAVAQMLKFPNGAHDDFVDFLSLIGQGLDMEFGPRKDRPAERPENDNTSEGAPALTASFRKMVTTVGRKPRRSTGW